MPRIGGNRLKVKDKVYYYTIKLDFDGNKVEQKREENTALGVNENYLVIDDWQFHSIKHKKIYSFDHDKLFNQVGVFGSQSKYSDYIYGYLYTSTSNSKIAYKRIKKALEKFIYQKHGRYCNAISFLDQIKI